jgi:uncharacterized protein
VVTDAASQVGEVIAFLQATIGGGGTPNGGPVRLYVTGADQWRDHPAWPVPGTRTTPPSRFRYDPADPTPNLGGPRIQGRRQVPQQALEARRDVLVFTGPVLQRPLEVIGPVQATVHLRSRVDRAQVFVRLCDVDATGRSWHVCDGIQRVDGACWPAGEDGARRVQVRLFPTAHRFAAGHRLRVLVAGGAHPRFVRSFGTDIAFGTATQGRPADHELLHDPSHPTRIELPVVGGQADRRP